MPIFDQGYQHWSGHVSRHPWRWLAVARHGVRVGLKNRMVQLALLGSMLPAFALAFVLCLWGLLEQKSDIIKPLLQFLSFLGPAMLNEPKHYRVEVWTLCYSYFFVIELFCSMVLVLLVGPNLISQDLRYNALPLYLSRPLRRMDYFFGKLGVIGAFLGVTIIAPAIIAYVLGLLFSLDLSIVPDTYKVLLASIAYGAVIVVSAGTLMLALSSLSRNSRYVAMFWLGIWFTSGIVATILQGVAQDQFYHAHAKSMQARRDLRQLQRFGPANDPLKQLTLLAEYQQSMVDLEKDRFEASKKDWPPLVSYTGNLARIGAELLGTDKSWEKIGSIHPTGQREEFLMLVRGPQYPWYWSAAVLVVLFGISACILHFSVRSLDRLR